MRLAVALAGVVLLAGCGSTRTVVRTVTVFAPSHDVVYGGDIASMSRSGSEYLLRFDPEFAFGGVTAGVAEAQDEHSSCAPLRCGGVPDDVYRVDETHRTYTFRLPATVTGVINVGRGHWKGTRITASQLAAIVAHRSRIKLDEPFSFSGIWITVRIDRVVSFMQGWRP